MPLFLTEYRDIGRDTGSNFIAAGMEPSVAEQTITASGTSGTSAAFNAQTSFVMVHAQEAVCLKWGTGTPVAVTTAQRMAAGETRFYGVPAGRSFKVAVILGV